MAGILDAWGGGQQGRKGLSVDRNQVSASDRDLEDLEDPEGLGAYCRLEAVASVPSVAHTQADAWDVAQDHCQTKFGLYPFFPSHEAPFLAFPSLDGPAPLNTEGPRSSGLGSGARGCIPLMVSFRPGEGTFRLAVAYPSPSVVGAEY